MKRGLRIAATVLGLILGLGMLTPTALAVGPEETVQIPIEIRRVGNMLPGSDTVTAELQPLTPGAPMPVQPKMTVSCKGAVTHTGFPIRFTALGIYRYRLTLTGSDHHLAHYGGAYPSTESYNVTVSIVNSADYTGYDTPVAICREGDGSGTKYGAAEHIIPYIDPLVLKVSKKWIDQNASRPDYVQIDLLCGGEVAQGRTLTLGDWNNWQGSWDDLDPSLDWAVRESDVPEGYTVSYRYRNGIWYVTNTGSLLQTGQLNWPIPVLCVLGFSLMAAGVWLLRRRREEPDGQ